MRKERKTKIIKPLIILLISIILLSTVGIVSIVKATSYKGYDANQWDVFKDRTKDEIGHEYTVAYNAGETYVDTDSSTYYSRTPSLTAPYDGGELTQDTLNAVEAKINYFRYLVGLEPLKTKLTSSDELQIGALVRNEYFDHNISGETKLDGMSDEMWQTAVACKHNVLAQGYTPQGAIEGWMDEGYVYNWGQFDTIGHRMTVIGQKVGEFKFGYAGSVAIGGDTSSNSTDMPYTAYPAPGYMPLNEINPKRSAWSIELNTNIIKKLNDYGNVKIIVTNLNSGESYDCTIANGNLRLDTLTGGYTLIFKQPDGTKIEYSEGDKYKVEVTGLKEESSGKDITLTYTTEFFDVTNYVDNTKVTAAGVYGQWKKVNIAPENDNTETLKKIAKILPKTIDVNTEMGRKATLPVQGEWVLDEENKCWTNTVNSSDIPSYMNDPDGKLKTIKIEYIVDNYLRYSNMNIDNNPTVGSSGKIEMNKMYRTIGSMSNSKVCEVYQIPTEENSTPILRFEDKIAHEEDKCEFNVDSYNLSDSGTYISLYYSDMYAYATKYGVYIVGIEDVNVTEPPIPATGITVDPTTLKMDIGDETTLTAKLTPEDTTDTISQWSSNDTSVATVQDGKVTAVGEGKATITVTTTNNIEAKCEIEVICSHKNKTEVPEKEATCIETGNNKYYICDDCGKVLKADGITETTVEDEKTEELGHDFSINNSDDKQHWKECSRCGETTEKEDHTTSGEWINDETSHWQVCECGAVINKAEHEEGTTIKENIVAPTCTEDGKHDDVIYCTECGYEISRTKDIVDKATGHKAGEPVRENEVAATCSKEGSYDEVRYCTECEAEISRETKTIEKLEHKPGAPVQENKVAATCTKEGSYDEVVYCTECGTEISRKTETIEKLEHKPGAPVRENEVKPTDQKEGSYDEVVYCTECGAEISRETKIIEKLEHKPGTPVIENEVAATCTSEGRYDEVVYCTECGVEISRETKTTEKLEHKPAEPVRENKVEATTEKEGSYDEVVYCTECGTEISRVHKVIDKIVYEILEIKSEQDGSVIVKANGKPSKFVGVKLNDIEIDESNYTIATGDATITLNPEYVKTLSSGTYKLSVVYDDGEVGKEFTISRSNTSDDDSENPGEVTVTTEEETENENKDETISSSDESEEEAKVSEIKDEETVETGDNSNITLWIIGFVVSGILFITILKWHGKGHNKTAKHF